MSFFLAVDIDEPVRRAVSTLIDAERATLEARWLRPEKLHVTLLFLGEPSAESLPELQARVSEVATRHAAFSLSLKGAGTFVTARAPSVLWLGVEGDLGALRALQHDLGSMLKKDEGREYVPHLTLARSQREAACEPLAQRLTHWTAGPFPVCAMVLYESTHAQYVARFSCALTK